ncbi:MAG: ATP-binding protein [Caulobacteraceae bacterium]
MPRVMIGVSRGLAAAALLTSLWVLSGYLAHNPTPVHVHAGLQGMSPVSAMGLFVLAAGVLVETWGARRLARALAGVGAAIGLLMLAIHGTKGHDVLSPWIAAHLFGFNTTAAGSTSIGTAACLLALGLAGVMRDRAFVADLGAGGAGIVSGVALLGYAYGVSDLYAMPIFRTMALHTAACLFALSGASLVARPLAGWAAVVASDEAGGPPTRRQLAFTLVPVAGGWLLLQITNAHRLGPAAAMALLVSLTVIPLAILILRDGRTLNALDAERRVKAALQRDQQLMLEDRLAAQAHALTVQGLERAKAEAALYRAHRMDAVGQLTGGIAHDFNNLLMAVGGNLQLLSKRLPADHPARRYADNATTAIDKGAKLTGQLLAFSRTQRIEPHPVELDLALAKARDLLGNALGPNIDIHMHLQAPRCWALTDADQLDLAIVNLALNARDAMPEGGTLSVSSGTCRTRMSDEAPEGDFLWVRVTDTGVGMDAEVAEKAVEPFFTTKERGQGTGLGLAQVYGFLRQCGGDLRITSAPGAGATIELLFAKAQAPVVAAAQAPKTAQAVISAAAGPKSLIVIDDDEAVRAVLVDALRAAGYQVAEAASGAAGLEILKSWTPSAAIIDFIMPGMNGAEVARRAQAQIPGLPVIFVSGYFNTAALDEIADAVIVRKPVDLEGLQRTVASVVH